MAGPEPGPRPAGAYQGAALGPALKVQGLVAQIFAPLTAYNGQEPLGSRISLSKACEISAHHPLYRLGNLGNSVKESGLCRLVNSSQFTWKNA